MRDDDSFRILTKGEAAVGILAIALLYALFWPYWI
jgi:hypothetical protein